MKLRINSTQVVVEFEVRVRVELGNTKNVRKNYTQNMQHLQKMQNPKNAKKAKHPGNEKLFSSRTNLTLSVNNLKNKVT